VVATDADREGEVIAREIMDHCKYKGSIQRLWLSALDDASIQKALNQLRPGSATESLYYAGLGRQRADWLVGMNMTMATSALFGVSGEGVLSVGRVQTPTLKLVVDRDSAIEHFKPKDYYVLLVEFSKDSSNERFWAKWQVPEDKADEAGRCLDNAFVQQVAGRIQGKEGTVQSFTDAKKKQTPPQCLSLSALQKLASSKFGLSAKKVLDIAQALYETHKATTYPRSDCGFLPESQFSEAKVILPLLSKIDPSFDGIIAQCNTEFQSPVWDDKKITAHHAIIPTSNPNITFQNMSEDERKIYDLIRRYYAAQFLGDYEYFQRTVVVECETEIFKASSHTPDQLGWKFALQNFVDESDKKDKQKTKNNSKEACDEDGDFESHIPNLSKNESVFHQANKLQNKQTKPPARFTEGTLIDAMKNVGREVSDPTLKKILKETAGIGTEATRANILETLFNREYLDRKGKQIISTEKGRALIDKLPEIVKNPAMTAQWEQALEAIAGGEIKLEDFILQQHEILYQMLGALAKVKAGMPVQATEMAGVTITCPLCQCTMVRRKGAKGFFYGCSTYPNCKGALPDLSQGIIRVQSNKMTNKYPSAKPIKYTGGYKKN